MTLLLECVFHPFRASRRSGSGHDIVKWEFFLHFRADELLLVFTLLVGSGDSDPRMGSDHRNPGIGLISQ